MNLSFRKEKNSQEGFTLLEVMISMVILVYVSLAVLQGFRSTRSQTTRTNDKAFATQKVVQLMSEIKSGKTNEVSWLDGLDDSGGIRHTLSILVYPNNPAHPLSGNPDKRYYRTITVSKVPNERTVRKVHVAVFLDKTRELLAEAAGVFGGTEGVSKPQQVFDVYVLSIGNVLAWPSPKPYYSQYLSWSRNVSLDHQVNVKVVENMGYGRDPFYTPYLNKSTGSEALDPINMSVYYYPGKVKGHHSGGYEQLYEAWDFNGRIWVNNEMQNPNGFFVNGYGNS